MQGDFMRLLQEGQRRVRQTKEAVASPSAETTLLLESKRTQHDMPLPDDSIDAVEVTAALPDDITGVLAIRKDIHDALAGVSESLARGYVQVKKDLADPNRVSWAGSAHEIREVLATMLRLLAPDKEVEKQQWYRLEPDTKGPTQKQRVRYIVQQHNAGSREREVVEQVGILDERIDNIGNLVRAIYSRASDAAHRSRERTEVGRIVLYFEAFAHDLLNLE